MSELSNKNFNQSPRIRTVIAPPEHERPAVYIAPVEPETTEKKRSKKALGIGIGATAAGLALAAGAMFAFGGLTNNETDKSPVAEAPADPSAEAPIENPETGFDYKDGFSVESYPTPESFADIVNSEFITGWANAGATEENRDFLYSGKSTMVAADYADYLAAENATEYQSIFFASDWQNTPSMVGWNENLITANARIIELYNATGNVSGQNPEDVESYVRTSNLVEVIENTENSDGSWSMTLKSQTTDNSDKNRADELMGGKPFEKYGVPLITKYTWVLEDGKWVVSNNEFLGYDE